MSARFVIEVTEEWRTGRGRWWCPNGNGYTDVLARAGLYARQDVEAAAGGSDRAVVRPALPIVQAEIDRLLGELAPLVAVREALLKGPPPTACTACHGKRHFMVGERVVGCARCGGSGQEKTCCASTPCCDRRDEYNGFASGPTTFTCPNGCACHD